MTEEVGFGALTEGGGGGGGRTSASCNTQFEAKPGELMVWECVIREGERERGRKRERVCFLSVF